MLLILAVLITIKDKVINLTLKERQLYGKLGDRTDNWIKKVSQFTGRSSQVLEKEPKNN